MRPSQGSAPIIARESRVPQAAATRGKIIAGVGVCLLFVVLRWNSYDAPLIRDEGEYAYSAQLLKAGLAPYEKAFLQKPPMVVYSYLLAQILAPKVFWFPRLLACLCVAGATWLLGWIARREFGPRVASSSVWLFTPMVLLPGLEQFTANTEMFMLLPLMSTLAVYVVARNQCSRLAWALAGFLGATTFWYKYTATPLLLYLFVVWSWEKWRGTRRHLWKQWAWGILGASLASTIILGFFVVKDGAKGLWECTVVFNRAYSASENFGWRDVWARVRIFWAHWWLLFLLPWALFLARGERKWFWVGIFGAAALATSGSVYGHYYIILMPFWALLLGAAIESLTCWIVEPRARVRVWAAAFRRFDARYPGIIRPFGLKPAPAGPPHPDAGIRVNFFLSPAWVSRVLTAIVLFGVCWSDVEWIRLTPQQLALQKLKNAPWTESRLAAQHVAELSAPSDKVFVAGSEPQILYYAQRFSPTRFVIVYPLMIPTGMARQYQQEAIRELEQHPPEVIVAVYSLSSWLLQEGSPPDFLEYLNELLKQYERVGGYISDGQRRYWQEPLADEDATRSTLVLYKRKK